MVQSLKIVAQAAHKEHAAHAAYMEQAAYAAPMEQDAAPNEQAAHAAHMEHPAHVMHMKQVSRVVACMQGLCDTVTHEEAAEALEPCHVASSPFLDPVTSAVAWLRSGGKAKMKKRSEKRASEGHISEVTRCKVIIKTLCGRSVTLDIDRDETIESLRSQIQDHGIMHSGRQHLIYEGIPLDGGCISDYCIHMQHRHKTTSTILVIDTQEINIGITVIVKLGPYKNHTGEVLRIKKTRRSPEIVVMRIDSNGCVESFERSNVQSLLSFKSIRRHKQAAKHSPAKHRSNNNNTASPRVLARDKNARQEHAQRVWTAFCVAKDPDAASGVFRSM